MKILLLVAGLLFVVPTFAQIIIDSTSYNEEKNRNLTIEDLFQYERECYNDSTVRYYYVLCDIECWEVPCDSGSINFMGNKCPENWEHVMPTFWGFINWMEERYENEKTIW